MTTECLDAKVLFWHAINLLDVRLTRWQKSWTIAEDFSICESLLLPLLTMEVILQRLSNSMELLFKYRGTQKTSALRIMCLATKTSAEDDSPFCSVHVNNEDIVLLVHLRCCSHTVSLVCTINARSAMRGL